MKNLQVRKELECDVVARRGLLTAKMLAEKVFVRFQKNETVLLGPRRAIEHSSSSVSKS